MKQLFQYKLSIGVYAIFLISFLYIFREGTLIACVKVISAAALVARVLLAGTAEGIKNPAPERRREGVIGRKNRCWRKKW